MKIWGACLLLVLFSCQDPKQEQKKVLTTKTDSSVRSLTINAADTIHVLYFDEPYADKERYQRFFKITKISDKPFAESLQNALRSPVVKDLLEPIDCLSEGKIIVPLGGDAFKVIYFGRQEKPCSYLYYIENGHFMYHELDSTVHRYLNAFQKKAKAL